VNRRAKVLVGLLGVAGLYWVAPVRAADPPPVEGEKGMVASDSALASEVGAEMLASGGNAADAAVAVASTLGVVHPFASGIGGGGFCLYFDASDGEVDVYDFRETAPAAATADMYLDAVGEPQPELSRRGGLAVAVPGEVAGLAALHSEHGVRPWSSGWRSATALARSGCPADRLLVERMTNYRDEVLTHPELAAWLLPGGQPPSEGQTLQNEALAATLEAIGEEGPGEFYAGERAEALAKTVTTAGGLLTVEDLAGYEVKRREALRSKYRDYEVVSMPPASSGGVALIEALNILEGFDLASMGAGSSASYHTQAEAMKFAFADRAAHMGDPDFVEVPVAHLIEPSYAETLRSKIKPDQVLPLDSYGSATQLTPDDGTAHFSIVDERGNAAACTTTINMGLGSMVYVASSGVLLNNEMDDFVQKPGAANAYGLVGTEANAVAPGKRPLSSMSPTLLLRDGKVFMAVGGSGGPQIISSTLQVIVNVVDFGMSARAAVEAPRIHHQWLPDELWVEPEVARDVVVNLESRSHKVRSEALYSAVQVVVVDLKSGRRSAASDPRKLGAPSAQPSVGASTPKK